MLYEMISKEEKIIWAGKPARRVILIYNVPIFLLGLLWMGISMQYMPTFSSRGAWYFTALSPENPRAVMIQQSLYFFIPAIVMLLAPVYQWLRWMAEEYVITDKRAYFASGIIGTDVAIVTMQEIINLSVTVGLVERITGTGTVRLTPDETVGAGQYRFIKPGYRFNSIEEPYGVFRMLRTLSLDVKTDIYYPNDMRPKTNPGYRTQYTGRAGEEVTSSSKEVR